MMASDLIYREDAKDYARHAIAKGLNVLEYLDEVPATIFRPVVRWVPVTERLPPAEKEVYVTDGEYIARANLLDEVFPGDKPCWSYSGLGEITHWCEQIPLPQPLKEE